MTVQAISETDTVREFRIFCLWLMEFLVLKQSNNKKKKTTLKMPVKKRKDIKENRKWSRDAQRRNQEPRKSDTISKLQVFLTQPKKGKQLCRAHVTFPSSPVSVRCPGNMTEDQD